MTAVPERIVLDTSAYAALKRGHPEVLDWVARAQLVLLPTIVLGELEAGFRLGSRYEANARSLAEFLAEPFVTIEEVRSDTSRRYGLIFADLRTRGRPIPVNDIWIAASTISAGAHLVSFDRHFEEVSGIDHTLLE